MIKLKTVVFVFIVVGSFSCKQQSENYEYKTDVTISDPRVIYGDDGRYDLYEITDSKLLDLADSALTTIKNSDLIPNGKNVIVKGRTFGEANNLCRSERFFNQNIGADCSGSLVGDDIVLTAGHCIRNLDDCLNTSFVFGFSIKDAAALPTSVSASEIYSCHSIVEPRNPFAADDFALIKLDRKVLNHKPLKWRTSGEVAVGDPLIVIGNPKSLPLKITLGGKVRTVNDRSIFYADLDTYVGNSGSAVINENTGLLEGILIRGDEDFVYNFDGNCNVSNVCEEGTCTGEAVLRISRIIPYLK